MPRVAPTRTSRCCAAGLSVLAATALLAAGAAPATAQTSAAQTQDVSGATSGSALTVTLNLPGGAATEVVLQLDPVTGTVSQTVAGTTATADSTVLRGSLGGRAMDAGTASAMLPAPRSASSDPAGALAESLAGTPLENLLRVGLLPSTAAVTDAPTSDGTAAVAGLGAGLPDALAGALAPLTDPLAQAADGVLQALSDASTTPVAELCAGVTGAVEALDPADGPLNAALAALPVPVPVQGLLDGAAVQALCRLSTTLDGLNTALQDALASLTGDSGVLGVEAATATQGISRRGAVTTSVAESTVQGLTLLGQRPFATTEALRTRSTAAVNGLPGGASTDVESTVAGLTGGTVDPFLQIRTTLEGIQGSSVGPGVLPTELQTLLTALFATLDDALGPIGVAAGPLDGAAGSRALQACPTELDGLLSGEFRSPDGQCAAAATRGVGVSVTLPTALSSALMITGPLVELQLVPTAAVAKAQPREVALSGVSDPAPATLPRTGGSAPLGLLGAGLLGAGLLARRRRRA